MNAPMLWTNTTLTHSQPSVAFHIETNHLLCSANQMTGFYMKCLAKVNEQRAHFCRLD